MKVDIPQVAIGDVHGKVDKYWKIIQKLGNSGESIQVGDFGFKKEHEWHVKNIRSDKHKVNFGNHDDYSFLNQPHSLGNFSVLNITSASDKIMTVRGAFSIDKEFRTENIDWWANEELNYQELQSAIDFFEACKPRIMITHDCPLEIGRHFFGENRMNKSMTSNGLQAMFEIHQPDLWIFGHHHKSKDEKINGTRFVCLEELEVFNI